MKVTRQPKLSKWAWDDVPVAPSSKWRDGMYASWWDGIERIKSDRRMREKEQEMIIDAIHEGCLQVHRQRCMSLAPSPLRTPNTVTVPPTATLVAAYLAEKRKYL